MTRLDQSLMLRIVRLLEADAEYFETQGIVAGKTRAGAEYLRQAVAHQQLVNEAKGAGLC